MATWVIAGASVLNVIVLGAYAWFTWGIWRETQRNAIRTDQLARQSRDAFRLQLVATYFEQGRNLPELSPDAALRYDVAKSRLVVLKRLFRAAFPDHWSDVESSLLEVAQALGIPTDNRK